MVSARLAAVAILAACAPESVTDARDQIGRGPARTAQLTFPIRVDTFYAGEFLSEDDTVTRPDGLLGIELDPDSVSVRVGERLRFDNVTFDTLAKSFPGGFPGGAGAVVSIDTSHQSLASEGRLQAIDTVVIESGTLTLTTQNKLPVALNYTVTLSGFVTAGGTALTGNGVVPAADGLGGTTSSSINFNLAGVTLRPATASAALSATATLTGAPINAAVNTSTVVQTGTATFVVLALAGSLDPAATPELIVTVENSEAVDPASIDFGDFESAVSGLTINDASALITVRNSALVPVQLSAFTLGLVQLDATGQLRRLPGGAPAYEMAGGAPILVSLADPAAATLTLGRGAITTLAINAAPLIDRLVHLVLGDTSVALVAAGTARAGDGQPGRIQRADDVGVTFGLTVGLDFTIPDTGVVFRPDSNARTGGLDLDSDDADDILARLVSAEAISLVTNGTPFGVMVEAAIVAGRQSAAADVFNLPGSLPLAMVDVPAAAVDANGRVTQPTDGQVTISLDDDQVRPFLGTDYTIGTRIRILPGPGGSGRAALRASDVIVVHARAQISVRGGSP